MHSNNFLKCSWTKDTQFIRLIRAFDWFNFKINITLSKNWYKENCSFERRPGSGRKPKFEESVKQKIINLVTDDPYKSIKDIKHELQNNFSKAPSIGGIYSILKDNGFWYVAPNLLQKLMIRLETKDLIGARETKVETGLI